MPNNNQWLTEILDKLRGAQLNPTDLETWDAAKTQILQKISETVALNRMELAKNIKHRHRTNDALKNTYLDAVIEVSKEQLTLHQASLNKNGDKNA